MNKKTATHNASDVYERFVLELLKQNPDYWTKNSRKKKRKMEFVYTNRTKGEVKDVVTFDRFLRVVKLYFLLARQKVVRGERLKLGHRLGAIQARTISRNFKNKKVNFAETRKQPIIEDPVTGKKRREKIVYYTSDTYCKIAWEKLGSIPGERIYKFVPSGGNKARGGFKQEFKKALRADPILETKFKQFINELSMD